MLRLPAICIVLAAALSGGISEHAFAQDDAVRFMERFSGEWRGSGKLLIGPDTGTKFHCTLNGDPSRTQLTFGMKGKCWMGRLSAPVFARLRYNGDNNRFYGNFMDGAEGDGVDIVAERKGDGFSMWLSRGELQGELVANPAGDKKMTITISLIDHRRDRRIPVVAMGFARDGVDGLPPYDPLVTGSLENPSN